MWNLKKAQKILHRQKPDGRWQYPNPNERVRRREHYDLLETFRQLSYLVEYFGFDKRHPERTLMYRVLFHHIDSFLKVYES